MQTPPFHPSGLGGHDGAVYHPYQVGGRHVKVCSIFAARDEK